MNTIQALQSLVTTKDSWHHIEATPFGDVFYVQPSDEESAFVVPIVTTLWERPWSVPFLAVAPAHARRIILVPRARPRNKLAVFAGFADELMKWETAIFADADVLVGRQDYLGLIQGVVSILTGGPETAGTFHAFTDDVAAIATSAPPFDGWGHEDIYLTYKLLTAASSAPTLPRFINARDTLAIAHPNTLRLEASDGAGPGIAGRRNYELLTSAIPDDHLSRMLFMHASRKWRDSTEHATEFTNV